LQPAKLQICAKPANSYFYDKIHIFADTFEP